MSDDCRLEESPRRFLKVVSPDPEDVGAAVMNYRVETGIEPVVVLIRDHHPVLLHHVIEESDEERCELGILLDEAENEVLVIAPEERCGSLSELVREVAPLVAQDQLELIGALLQLALEIHAGRFVRVVRIECSTVEHVSVEDHRIGPVGFQYRHQLVDRQVWHVQIRQHHRSLGVVSITKAVDDLIIAEGIGDIGLYTNSPLNEIAVIDDNESPLPKPLVRFVLTMLVVGILVGGTNREMPAVIEDESVDGGHHMWVG